MLAPAGTSLSNTEQHNATLNYPHSNNNTNTFNSSGVSKSQPAPPGMQLPMGAFLSPSVSLRDVSHKNFNSLNPNQRSQQSYSHLFAAAASHQLTASAASSLSLPRPFSGDSSHLPRRLSPHTRAGLADGAGSPPLHPGARVSTTRRGVASSAERLKPPCAIIDLDHRVTLPAIPDTAASTSMVLSCSSGVSAHPRGHPAAASGGAPRGAANPEATPPPSARGDDTVVLGEGEGEEMPPPLLDEEAARRAQNLRGGDVEAVASIAEAAWRSFVHPEELGPDGQPLRDGAATAEMLRAALDPRLTTPGRLLDPLYTYASTEAHQSQHKKKFQFQFEKS
ncbi:hypothetical protein STCU_11826 [Strigomonas culicis]|uniref:Uncharacterized protein n=1 Tax=Strigomonas culicis TaxID=28005 RepID=S9UYU1_9TRYP|nr:hypothetical protein STCU_11826 [Strigomonas culicis]|eukprot:EPY15690.1 hypothetical protein STCU_11826 [Strigomonas culicis]